MSRFVSAGTTGRASSEDDDAWKKAQQSVEENKKQIEKPHPNDGKSLYEVLQANKDAKQEAFEESIRLKNQFRSLDEDEVDFLDSVLESSRAQEAAVRKETADQLDQFRKQREEAQHQARATEEDNSPVQEEPAWHSGPRKRRRNKEKDVIKGVKLRKVSSNARTDADQRTSTEGSRNEINDHNPEDSSASLPTNLSRANSSHDQPATPTEARESRGTENTSHTAASFNLGLGAYSSEEE